MQKWRHKKYRSETVRLRSWDYGWNAPYFVTICTDNRKCYFGKVVESKKDDVTTDVEMQDFVSLRSNSDEVIEPNKNKKMQLSKIGKIAESCWQEIPEHFPFVKLGEFVVMPNHVHGIIIIDKKNDGRNNVETEDFASLRSGKQKSLNTFGPQSKNLPSIIRGFKIGVTKKA